MMMTMSSRGSRKAAVDDAVYDIEESDQSDEDVIPEFFHKPSLII